MMLVGDTSGLYYKTITIVIDAPSVVKSEATIWSITFDNTRSVDYDRNMAKLASSITFMVLASFTSVIYECHLRSSNDDRNSFIIQATGH